jgi:DUF438 domain-containing protein
MENIIPPRNGGLEERKMKNDAIIVYLTGKPGIGKYTIAKALAKNYDFIICDNQLINNPIFELLQYDGYATIPDFAWDAIARIRTEIFALLTKVPQNNYILTNCLAENDEDKKLYEEVEHMAHLRNSIFIPVRLSITKEKHLKRIVQQERRARWKSIDPREADDHGPMLSITHPNLLELDITTLAPENAAEAIAKHIEKIGQL